MKNGLALIFIFIFANFQIFKLIKCQRELIL
jgi:hypothetical protein